MWKRRRPVPALAPIAPKLDPLIRRLASDQDGERLACIAAIERQLAKAGASFHDLADQLTRATETPANGTVPTIFYDYLTAVEWMLATDHRDLTGRDIDFLESMRGILYRFPPRPKQAAWLRALVEKCGGEFHG